MPHSDSATTTINETSPLPDDRKAEIQLTDQTNLLPFKKVVIVFLGLALCFVTSTLDSVIVATALPTISTAFNAGSIVSWVPSAYLLTSTSFQPLYGRLSDIFGRKAALSAGMCIFMVGNLIAGFSGSIVQLIFFRGIAGAGGGGIVSMAQIVISDIVSLRDRGKYQGIIGGVNALGYAAGPLIGGALVQKVSWRWCFWITIPVSLIAVGVVMFVLPLKRVQGDIRRQLLSVDYLGAVLSLVGCALVILPLIWGGVTFPWKSAIVLAPLFSGFLVIVIFCLWEWKGARLPIVPMYIFRHLTVTGVYIAMFVNGFVFFSSLYYLPQFFQVALGYTPIRAGVFLIPVLVSQMVISWTAGVIVSRTGRYRTIIHIGFAVWAIACGLISTIKPSSGKAALVVYMLLAGIGGGQTLQTTTVAAQASVARKDMSVVTAFRNFIRLLGGTLSLAIGSTILNNSLRQAMTPLSLSPTLISAIISDPSLLGSPGASGLDASTATEILSNGYTRGFRAIFLLNAALCAFATVVSVVMIKHKDLTRGDEEKLRDEARERVASVDMETKAGRAEQKN
ncbi:major facilitator superfamily domain-containing protein [Infundibulicybe gibba]|nr:major facilitator superfamily domain-containing protein [Infundibulicybe gibba]